MLHAVTVALAAFVAIAATFEYRAWRRRARARQRAQARATVPWPGYPTDITRRDLAEAIAEHAELMYPDAAAAGRALARLHRHFANAGVAFDHAMRASL